MSAIDHIAEESKAFFIHVPFRDEYAPTYLPDYSASFWADQKRAGDLENAENYSPDSDWMPKVVMIAKNSFVWLSQLSKQYQRNIQYLSDIPNETLDELAEWGGSPRCGLLVFGNGVMRPKLSKTLWKSRRGRISLFA